MYPVVSFCLSGLETILGFQTGDQKKDRGLSLRDTGINIRGEAAVWVEGQLGTDAGCRSRTPDTEPSNMCVAGMARVVGGCRRVASSLLLLLNCRFPWAKPEPSACREPWSGHQGILLCPLLTIKPWEGLKTL